MRRAAIVFAISLATGLGGCGGGGMSAPTSPPVFAPDPSAGPVYDYFGVTSGSSSRLGPILYGPCGQVVCIERVTVDGVAIAETHTAMASGRIVRARSALGGGVDVDIQYAAVGVIEAIDSQAGIVTVLGQRIHVFSGPSGLVYEVPILVGDRIAVSGFFTGDGDIHPTRIEKTVPGFEDSVRGVLTGGGSGWRIGALEIDLTSATLVGFPASAPLSGDAVRAVGRRVRPGGMFVATAVEYAGGEFPATGSTVWELEGFVTAARAATDFDVAGLRVAVGNCNCSQFTRPLPEGALVTARAGHRPTGGTEVSSRVLFERHRFTGPIDSIDTAAETVTVLGFTARMTAATVIGSNDSITTWGLDPTALRVGDWVVLAADDIGGPLFAGGVRRTDTLVPSIYTWGGAITLEDPFVRVLRQPILTDSNTTTSYCGAACGWNSVRDLFASGVYAYTDVTITLASAGPPLLATRVSIE